MRRDAYILEPAEAAIVRGMVVKTSLIIQLRGTETSVGPAPLYKAVNEGLNPAPNTQVWASTVAGEDWGLRAEALAALVVATDDQPDVGAAVNTLAVTLGLGSLLIHTVTTTLPELTTVPLDELLGNRIVSLWPNPSGTQWPIPQPLLDHDAWFVAHSLGMWLGP